jgi:type I restriction enzyme, S subunit
MVTYPQGWETYRVIDVADLFDNLRIPVTKNQRRPGNTPYYGANGIQDYVDGYTHDGEFVLIAEDGANDLLNYPVTYAKGKIWVNNHAHVISAKESVAVTKFLYYLLKKVDYTTFLVGGTRAKLNGKTFKNIEITIPSNTSEQKAISSILSDLDNHIDNLGKLIEKKKNIRDGALEDLISGKTRLDGFDDVWQETTIGDCTYILQGGTPSTTNANYWNGNIVWVTPSEITKLKGMFISDSERKITESGLKNSSAQILPAGTILLCSRATIGELAIAEKPMTTNQGFKNLVCKVGIDNVFMAYLLSTLKDIMISKAKGTTFLELSKKALETIKVKIPKYEEQQAIASVLTAMDKEIEHLEAEREKMIQIREGVMDDLLTGRVRLTV